VNCTKEEILDVVKKAEKQFGPIDVLFNNAGLSKPGMFLDDDALQVAKDNMELNYFGAFKIVHTIGQRLASRGKGRICLVGSVCSFASFPGYAGYAASKFALRALSDSMNHEFGSKGVKCHMFLPGSIDSPGFIEENKTKPDVA